MRRGIVHLTPCLLLALLPAAARAQVYYAQPVTPPLVIVAQPQQMRSGLGGGFIEFLFGENNRPVALSPYAAPAPQPGVQPPPPAPPIYANVPQQADPMLEQQRADLPMDPQFLPTEVLYRGNEPPGTLIVDTPHHFLYLIEEGGRARRYGIGVGRPGFTWSGEHKISAKKEWPDWVPPEETLWPMVHGSFEP